MSFDVAAEAYGQFMGRFSEPLADAFADTLALRRGLRALDVGCGPGALTARLVDALGADAVSAVDPSAPFVAAARQRFPEVDIREASAEQLPYDDAAFDVTAAELVVHFLADPVAGIAEMARVTLPGGLVAACVWDFGSGRDPLNVFWTAVRHLDPTAHDESGLPGTMDGQLVSYFESAGLTDVRGSLLSITVPIGSFEDWWRPFTLGVGPAGSYVSGLDAAARERLRDECERALGDHDIRISASAWSATGVR
ncbi:MAG: Methyltransferase type 11 [Frankiales bacterium]|nr:Methyltransferase type 11 [Frankiales bacterium]